MRKGGGRVKGNSFERKIAKMIIDAACKCHGKNVFGKKDCYRTPLSGGHPYALGADLVFSNKLRRLFSWAVECKHNKTFKEFHLFKPTKSIHSFMTQSREASNKDRYHRPPMVVVSGNRTEIYAIMPNWSWGKLGISYKKIAGYGIIKHKSVEWIVIRFVDVLKLIFPKGCKL